jgi:two-component system response regulator HydG
MAAILIVDDDSNIRNHLAAYIASLGYTTEIAADASAALAALERRSFDIVFSDVCMEGMGGLALLREIRQRRGNVAVVLMTAYATVPQAVEAMRAGAYEYLMKPFSPEDLRLVINHVLDIQALQRGGAAGRRASDETNSPRAALATKPDLSLKDLERRRIEQALAEAPTFEEAAGRLGINPTTLWRKRKRYGIG